VVKIFRPSRELLQECMEIELHYAADSDRAAKDGFFLPGVTAAVYEDLFSTGYVRAIASDSGGVGAFIVVVPPGHSIIRRLLNNNESLVLFDRPGAVSEERAIWIAKIATSPGSRRQGLATALYRQVFSDFAGFETLTATAVSPLRNRVSEAFHRSVGMQACGIFLAGKREYLDNVVNIVWKV
jgi:GNAT superfamily N-acetyltransferase